MFAAMPAVFSWNGPSLDMVPKHGKRFVQCTNPRAYELREGFLELGCFCLAPGRDSDASVDRWIGFSLHVMSSSPRQRPAAVDSLVEIRITDSPPGRAGGLCRAPR